MAVTEVRRNDGACERVLRGGNPQREGQGMRKREPLYCTVDNSETTSGIGERGSRMIGRPEKMRRKEYLEVVGSGGASELYIVNWKFLLHGRPSLDSIHILQLAFKQRHICLLYIII